MARKDRRKPDGKPIGRSQRVNYLKAKALTLAAKRDWARNLPYKTIALLSEALRREPTNQETLLNLASAYGRQRDYDKADELLNRLLHLAPRKASVHHQVAEIYRGIDRADRAIQCYRRCLALSPDKRTAVAALLDLATLHERRHELDDASAAIDEALALDAGDGEAQLQRALLQRRRGDPSRAESLLREIIACDGNSWSINAAAWYELANVLDAGDHCDEAFQALVSAKQSMRGHSASYARDYQEMADRNDGVLSQLSSSHFERWRELGANDEPCRLAILTGHPRSGTTLVEQVLDSHDQAMSADEWDVFTQWIYMPIVRRFPSSAPLLAIVDRVPPAVRREARATYYQRTEAAFGEPIGDRLLIDKNPGMTMLLPMVNWAFPEAKTLIALRDPRDVLLSCFMQRLPLNSISVNWLSLDTAADYYARMMDTWLAVRRITQGTWLEFRYEEVVADLPGQARRILDFLGLPWDEKVLQFHEHARQKLVRSPTYEDVTKPVYQGAVGRWRRYAKFLEPTLDRLRPYLKEFGYAET